MAKRPASPAGESAPAITPAIPPDPAQAALLQAVAAVGLNPAPILPKGTAPEILPERRIATVASAIEHDGYRFAPGEVR